MSGSQPASAQGGAEGGTVKAAKVPTKNFEDLVDLCKIAFPQEKPDGQVQELKRLFREYLAGVDPDRREAPVLAAARHALLCSRVSGRPSLGSYACSAVVKTTLPRLMELCHRSTDDRLVAYPAVLVVYHDNGLFANLLQVLDALLLSRPDTCVYVDWQRKGTEGHFQYGPEGFDLWAHLFQTSRSHPSRCRSASGRQGTALPQNAVRLSGRINPVFMNMLRGYVWTLPEADMSQFRRSYEAAMAGILVPAPHVQEAVEEVCAPWSGDTGTRASTVVVGVHKRLGTPEVAACQLSQRAPTSAEFISAARAAVLEAPNGVRRVVFLATDDQCAVEAFREAFPPGAADGIELICRSDVKRTEGGLREDGVDNEVHRSPCEAVDAEDALVDALCLARCDDLVCIDSNLSIFVALQNPTIRLHALNSILPLGWEEAANSPADLVYPSYEVICSPMIFVRRGPSAACELLGARKQGDVVHTTGRGFDGWVELQGGGWVLEDGERQAIGKGRGKLLRPREGAAPET